MQPIILRCWLALALIFLSILPPPPRTPQFIYPSSPLARINCYEFIDNHSENDVDVLRRVSRAFKPNPHLSLPGLNYWWVFQKEKAKIKIIYFFFWRFIKFFYILFMIQGDYICEDLMLILGINCWWILCDGKLWGFFFFYQSVLVMIFKLLC